jgi:hypothetical protein
VLPVVVRIRWIDVVVDGVTSSTSLTWRLE